MKVLVPHGITPTGVGIRQNDDGTLRPLTPCCGQAFLPRDSDQISGPFCPRCGTDYTALLSEVAPKTLANDVRVYTDMECTLNSWLQAITGDPGATMEVSE